jgi:hypothetical protein
MWFHKRDTALVIIDPQNDILSDKGISWGLVCESIQENDTVENLARLIAADQRRDQSGERSRKAGSRNVWGFGRATRSYSQEISMIHTGLIVF